MIIKAEEARKINIRNSQNFKRLCEYFNQDVKSGKNNFNFYISPEFRDAEKEFLNYIIESGYKYSIVNNDTVKISY